MRSKAHSAALARSAPSHAPRDQGVRGDFTTGSLTAAALGLQRTLGNRLTGRLLAGALVQPKLTINRPGDRYEQEADRVADQVMQRQPAEDEDETLQAKPSSLRITPLVQRQTIPEEENDEEDMVLQRQSLIEDKEDEEEILQTKTAHAQAESVTSSLATAIESARQGGGQPLDPAERAFLEPRYGQDFGNVRVHTGPRAAAAAQTVSARAFTVGRDVIFGAAQYAPTTLEGQRLLAHELAHVVQQEGADQRAAITDPGSAPEQEAARATARVLRGDPAGHLSPAGIGPARYEPGEEEAQGLIDYLLGVSLQEAETFIEQIADSRYLRVVRSELAAQLKSMDVLSPNFDRLEMLYSLVMTRLTAIEATGMFKDFKEDFEDLVRRIIKRTKGTRISADDEKELRQLLSSLSVQEAKELEKMIVLSPLIVGHPGKAAHIIEIVTSFSRTTSTLEEEAERGLFVDGDLDGSEIKEQLSTATEEFEAGTCWDFLHARGLEILYADKEKVKAAKARYAKGASERMKEMGRGKKSHGAQTLSRGAAELRLEGLLGPVNVLRWKGRASTNPDVKPETGRHEPSPAKLVTDLSSAGDGWYFFFANLLSYHTFIIAVEAVGSGRKFFVIEAGDVTELSEEKLNYEFDREYDPTRKGKRKHTKAVGSRIWQVYAKPVQ